MTELIKKTSKIPATLNAQVSMDDVAAVFVSKYEISLYAKKDYLSKKLKATKANYDKFLKDTIDSIDTKKYVVEIKELGVSSEVFSVSFKQEEFKISVKLKDDTSTSQYSRNSFEKVFTKKPTKAFLREVNKFEKTIKELSEDIVSTMADIKGVSRKEREVKGRISEARLKESGYEDFLNDKEMLKIIEVK